MKTATETRKEIETLERDYQSGLEQVQRAYRAGRLEEATALASWTERKGLRLARVWQEAGL